MDADTTDIDHDLRHRADQARIRELEARLEESEDTLEAIRRGDFDAVVVEGENGERQVYTLENTDRPYRVLIEQIQEGALTLSAEGTVLYCNRRLAEMLDVRQERLIGQPLKGFVPVEDEAALTRLLEDARLGVARGELSLAVERKGRMPVYLSLSLLARDEATPLLCGVLTDLTEQKSHLRELAGANLRLEAESLERERIEDVLRQAQKMEAVGQLTGGIAHDFNNLLTVIKSSTDLLRRPDLPEERRRRYVDAISDTVDRASKLTGQLLSFARRQALTPTVFDVTERVHAITDMLGTIVGSRIRIERIVPGSPCYIEADTSQFETALVNLAVNARDAMDGEGRLTLEVHCGTVLPAIRGHAAPGGSFVAVMVTDTGCGIPPDRIGRIFEPFYTTKEVGKGTGLGLSQVFGFAKQSGGDVEVESVPGQGTTFTLYLPETAPAPVQEQRSIGEPAASGGSGQRVLVVEDNVDVGRFATQILQDLGYETTWATNGREALEHLGADGSGFDAMFSDVVMPGMSGIELAQEVRRRMPGLPVVLTSGYSHVLAQEGSHGFELLDKPYSAEQLSRILQRVAARPSGQ